MAANDFDEVPEDVALVTAPTLEALVPAAEPASPALSTQAPPSPDAKYAPTQVPEGPLPHSPPAAYILAEAAPPVPHPRSAAASSTAAGTQAEEV